MELQSLFPVGHGYEVTINEYPLSLSSNQIQILDRTQEYAEKYKIQVHKVFSDIDMIYRFAYQKKEIGDLYGATRFLISA